MSKGTDSKIFKKDELFREKSGNKGGRPRVNRELVLRLLKSVDSTGRPRYNHSQIASLAGCKPRIIGKIKKEAIEAGILTTEDRNEKALAIVEVDFDKECIRANGYSFLEWLETQTPSSYKRIFNFSRKTWEQIWNSPSLVDVKDRDLQLGDKLAQDFLRVFGEDKQRIRRRKKNIRYLFRFLGRDDICTLHLRMKDGSDPREIRSVPEVSMTDFPLKLVKCIAHMGKMYPATEDKLGGDEIIEFKIVTQARTGKRNTEKDTWGLRTGSEGESYLLMNDVNEYQCRLFSKQNKYWDMIWMPRKVRESLWRIYKNKPIGSFITEGIALAKFRTEWGDITEKIIGRRLSLHDLRKVSITWLFAEEIALEICTQMNEGWDDMNTATRHYLQIRKFLRGSIKEEYRKNIPDWFKEGLEDFRREEAVDKIKVI
jgi:hypothetical protein